MKLKKLVILLSAFALCSCGNETSSYEETTPEDEEHEQKEAEYVLWPEEDVKIVVQGINKNATDTIPAFEKATKVTIDWDLYLEEGYFGIYCDTKDENSVEEYKATLVDNGYDIDTKVEEDGYYNAFSPNGEIWLNFGYSTEFKQLEIYATEGMFIHWPATKISEYVTTIIPDTTTAIPAIETGTSYTVNVPANIQAIAINVWGLTSASVATYKGVVEQAGWTTEFAGENEYNAYSPDEKVKINFYFDSYSFFNIDVFPYTKPIEGWPYEEIASFLTQKGLVGEVLPYTGVNNGFQLDDEYYPPSIFVYVDEGTQAASAAAYNQMLLDNGYKKVGTMFYDDVYGKDGTTLAYHAVYLNGKCFTIELFNISEITPL